MTTAERLIEEVLAASRLPSGKRRHDVRRELRAHMDDFVNLARQSGSGEEEIERLLGERFGDAQEIARQFAQVYGRERAALHLGGFLISTVVVSFVISTAAIAMETGIMVGFGAPVSVALGSHSVYVALDIVASAATYLALLSLGRFFRRPLQVLAAIAGGLIAVFVATGLPPQYILFGFANGVMLRGIQVVSLRPALRLSAAVACFGVLGVVFFHPSPSAIFITSASWLMMGTAYHLMTHVADRVDRALAARL